MTLVLTQRDFGFPEAVHLLSRLQFGVSLAEVDRAVREGLEATLDRLLTPQPESDEFQQTEQTLRATALATSRIDDLKTWWHFRMLSSANPLLEKLTFMWHNHFATSYAKVGSVPLMATQNDLFRQHALGSFRTLLTTVARDPAMLVWLDGNANRRRHPNENFAREVMELFTLGIGNYTERDIQEAARAFSGWHLRNGAFWFNASQHDPSAKTIFGQTGVFRGDDVLERCLNHTACPRFLATRLLRTFVTSQPSAALIDVVAEKYRQHQLQTAPVLREVCSSAEFFAPEHRRTMIKSPLDFVLGTLRLGTSRVRWDAVRGALANMGQDIFQPASVKGWDGGRQWIHSTGWILRWNYLHELCEQRKIAELDDGLRDDLAQRPADLQQLLVGNSAPAAASSGRWQAELQRLLSLPEYQLM